eukprot:549179-Amorphochlora_amoeboformis.AAC.1
MTFQTAVARASRNKSLMVGSAPFFLLLCLPSFSASVTFPVQRADKATIPVDIITAAKNDSNKVEIQREGEGLCDIS